VVPWAPKIASLVGARLVVEAAWPCRGAKRFAVHHQHFLFFSAELPAAVS
jgi:hypothetical protein